MKFRWIASLLFLLSPAVCEAQNGSTFTNFIRQVQLPSGVERDMSVSATGEALSPLAIDPGGARFELWTVKNLPLTNYLLDSRYVGTYVPIAQVAIRSEDTYGPIPRTRADRPFWVDISLSGLLAGAGDPEASKQIKFLQHYQSYGATGTGIGINRTLATLASQVFMNQNGTTTLTFPVNTIPGANRAKIRGEQRFSAFSIADYQSPESQLASQFIQIWPVADGSIAGIASGQHIRYELPSITFAVNDVYPGSSVYAQAYKGPAVLGTEGVVIPGSAKNYTSETVPQNHLEAVSGYESILDSDGQWTIELLTSTPFGLERLAHVTFTYDRTLRMNGTVTTID